MLILAFAYEGHRVAYHSNELIEVMVKTGLELKKKSAKGNYIILKGRTGKILRWPKNCDPVPPTTDLRKHSMLTGNVLTIIHNRL